MSNIVKISNGTWTDESLPEARRKELLQEDLRKYWTRGAAKGTGDRRPELAAAAQSPAGPGRDAPSPRTDEAPS